MSLKEDILDMKKEVQEVKEQSLAMELLKDSKRANKRICFAFTSILILTILLWFMTICYLIHILNDIGTEEITTTETYEVEQDADNSGNNNFIHGNNNEVK